MNYTQRACIRIPRPSPASVAYLDDLQWHDVRHRPRQLEALRHADVIMTTYAHHLLAYYPELAQGPPKPIKWIPHCAQPYFFLPLVERPPRHKILLSGWAKVAKQQASACAEGGSRRLASARLSMPAGLGWHTRVQLACTWQTPSCWHAAWCLRPCQDSIHKPDNSTCTCRFSPLLNSHQRNIWEVVPLSPHGGAPHSSWERLAL